MKFLTTLAALVATATAWESPQYPTYTRLWQATFVGPKGTLPHPANWNIITGDENHNNEFQRFTSSTQNVLFSGASQGTLQIIPRRDASAPNGWTSGRIESKYTILPRDGKVTRIESSLRLAGNPRERKQGIWPAFWMLGDSYRKGLKAWPACGEIDIMETINGEPLAHSTAHCDVYPGGVCNEPSGLSSGIGLLDNQFHVWRVEFDRTKSDFKKQEIRWYMDNLLFSKITGQQVGNPAVWSSLCQSPMYIILNVAVGGNWPGPPTANTWGGTGSMMEVGYVAHYVSK